MNLAELSEQLQPEEKVSIRREDNDIIIEFTRFESWQPMGAVSHVICVPLELIQANAGILALKIGEGLQMVRHWREIMDVDNKKSGSE